MTLLTKELLNEKTVTELYEMARTLDIPSYRKLKKDALIKTILNISNAEAEKNKQPAIVTTPEVSLPLPTQTPEKVEKYEKHERKEHHAKREHHKHHEKHDKKELNKEAPKEIAKETPKETPKEVVVETPVQTEKQTIIYAQGILEVLPEGYGFLRVKGYLLSIDDIYVS